MLKKIIKDRDELSQSSDNIDMESEKKLADKIIRDLKDNIEGRNLVALSAPQIGYKYKIFCIKYKGRGKKIESSTMVYVNPIIVSTKNMSLSRDTDICMPGKTYINLRYDEIQMMYQNEKGEPLTNKFVGKTAQIIQQMVDHLDGVLMDDVGLEIDEDFDNATEEEKNELLDVYIKKLGEYKEKLDKEIEETPELKEMSDAVKFMQSVQKGETQLGEQIGVSDNNELVYGNMTPKEQEEQKEE